MSLTSLEVIKSNFFSWFGSLERCMLPYRDLIVKHTRYISRDTKYWIDIPVPDKRLKIWSDLFILIIFLRFPTPSTTYLEGQNHTILTSLELIKSDLFSWFGYLERPQACITSGLSQKNSRDVKTKLNQILINYLVQFGFDISRVFLR